jgi:hypothetical protein
MEATVRRPESKAGAIVEYINPKTNRLIGPIEPLANGFRKKPFFYFNALKQ